jgi:hypothetical protein
LTYKLLLNNDSLCQPWILYTQKWDRRGHDGMTVGFTTTCAISSHHHDICSNPAHGEAYLMLNYVIKCVSDLRQVGGFLRILWSPFHKRS